MNRGLPVQAAMIADRYSGIVRHHPHPVDGQIDGQKSNF
jgi:hypothetical protein